MQVHFDFVMVPLTFAYFFTFLVAPVMNFLEFRPLVIGSSHPHERGVVCCIDTEPDPDYKGERRYEVEPCVIFRSSDIDA